MAEHQPANWTLWCIVIDAESPFPVEIQSDTTVGVLKKKIKNEKQHDFTGFDADRLTLYLVNLPDDDNLANNVKRPLAIKLPPVLKATEQITDLFPDRPAKRTVCILVQTPGTSPNEKPKTPENRPGSLPHAKSPKSRISLGVVDAQDDINAFMETLRPDIRKFLAGSRVSHWTPPANEVTQEITQFYARLQIPYIGEKPRLLLHALRESPNPNGHVLFSGKTDRILCNTSGSGKTRLLFEGLTRHWGFYWACAKGTDKLGSMDLQDMIVGVDNETGWIKDIFACDNVKDANKTNENIVTTAMLRVLLARWNIFRLFIEEGRNQGRSFEDLKQDWLYFQILPGKRDVFLDLIQGCLKGISLSVLHSLRVEMNPQSILGPEFNKNSEPFFYVLDEMQIAAEEYLECFSNKDGIEPRPILRPIIRTLSQDPTITAIVSGTGFSLSTFQTVLASGVGKGSSTWKTEYSTGDFVDPAIQSSYISRYLPHSYLNSPSGKVLMKRMRRWLPGRHRFTAAFIEILLQGGWNDAGPVAPHRLLNEYISKLSFFTPLDDEGFLAHEPRVTLDDINTFEWTKIERKNGLLEKLAYGFYSRVMRGELPITWPIHQELVEYGLARFILPEEVSRPELLVTIGEPLALLSIRDYLQKNGFTMISHIQRELSSNQGVGFEEVLVFAMTMLLQGEDLGFVFEFLEKPDWARSKAQIVARSGSGTFEAFTGDQLQKPSREVVFYANTSVDVKHWLEHSEAPWCRPGPNMGPDLLTRVKLDGEKVLLLVIQAKCHFSGNTSGKIDTVTAEYTADAIRKVRPSRFFSPERKTKLGRSRVNAMLKAINLESASFTEGPYNILGVVAAFPLDANFSSYSPKVKTAIKADSHALAKLSHDALVSALADPDGTATVLMLKKAVKRRREDQDCTPASKKVNRGRRVNSG